VQKADPPKDLIGPIGTAAEVVERAELQSNHSSARSDAATWSARSLTNTAENYGERGEPDSMAGVSFLVEAKPAFAIDARRFTM